MIKCLFNIDIIDFDLTTALKRISVEHKARKANVFSQEQAEDFIINADERLYAITKLIWIIGFYGGLRKSELHAL